LTRRLGDCPTGALFGLSASNECAHYRAAQLGHDFIVIDALGKVGLD
jgi:hypothetical protein